MSRLWYGRQLSRCGNYHIKVLQESRRPVLGSTPTLNDAFYKSPILCRLYHSGRTASKRPSSHQVRRGFIEYFESRDHLHVPSSSIIPRAAGGTYFVNAGMNQFKPIFLGMVDPSSPLSSYQRVVNSQRCVRVGGKHNDLEDVGKDTTHHTFFEMLGSWSFGNYFKREACQYTWELLTSVYGIPPAHLYVTYFSGDEQLGLKPDLECKDIWREIGLPAERVIPSGMADNFWDMGDTGPCGPCTEIHYAYNSSGRLSHLVNSDSTNVLEIWNLVFMQYDRQPDGSLMSLPRQHVDTGMGLERITAILQGQTSNYDTDLFTPIFKEIHNLCSVKPYGGLIGTNDMRGIDTAYRVVADHIRMATVAIADGLRPGNKDLDSKLKLIIHRALRQARDRLRAPINLMGNLVPIVIDTLGDGFPTNSIEPSSIAEVLNVVERKLWEMEISATVSLDRCLKCYNHPATLTGEQVIQLCEGRFGKRVSLDVIEDVCRRRNISLHLKQIHEQIQARKQAFLMDFGRRKTLKHNLDQHEVAALEAQNVPHTDDTHKYNYLYDNGDYFFPPLDVTVCGLIVGGEVVESVCGESTWGVLLDRTCFYAEAGGQVADSGYLQTVTGRHIHVSDVQVTSGYVLHTCHSDKGQMAVGDKVTIFIDQEARRLCMNNHTGTHVLNHALEEVLGGIRQQGSMISPTKLTFDFTCSKMVLDSSDIQKVAEVASELVSRQLTVYKAEMTLERAMKVNGLRCLHDEVYPSTVLVVSIGAPSERLLAQTVSGISPTHSAELCAGTHVHNTGDLEALVVTNLHGMAQGTRRITVITGQAALQAIKNAQTLRAKLNKVNDVIDDGGNMAVVQTQIDEVEQVLGEGSMVLPKLEREALQSALNLLKRRGVNPAKNAAIKTDLMHRLEVLLKLHVTDGPLVQEFNFIKPRDLSAVLYEMKPRVPVMLVTSQRLGKKKKESVIMGVCYVPTDSPGDLSPRNWAEHVATSTEGNQHPPHSKPGKPVDSVVHVLSIPMKNTSLQHVQELALSYANLFKNKQS